MKRLYFFILLSVAIQNLYLLWKIAGCSDVECFEVYDRCMMALTCIFPTYAIVENLHPATIREPKYFYVVAITYLFFQVADTYQMVVNGNTENAAREFFLFCSLNVSYWVIFRKR
jgi:hypothetical protein